MPLYKALTAKSLKEFRKMAYDLHLSFPSKMVKAISRLPYNITLPLDNHTQPFKAYWCAIGLETSEDATKLNVRANNTGLTAGKYGIFDVIFSFTSKWDGT